MQLKFDIMWYEISYHEITCLQYSTGINKSQYYKLNVRNKIIKLHENLSTDMRSFVKSFGIISSAVCICHIQSVDFLEAVCAIVRGCMDVCCKKKYVNKKR